MLRTITAATLIALACASPVWAQTSNASREVSTPAIPQQATSGENRRNLELSAGAQNLSAGLGSWRDLTLRGTYGLPLHVIQAELSAQRRFNTNGAFFGLSDTYTFNDDVYASVAAGAGDGAFYLPRYRLDATLYRKLLADRRLVGSVGVGFYKAPDGHSDRSLALGLVYYFEAPWVAEGGVRLNSSNPGQIRTQQQFVAVTYGRNKQDLISARYGWGSEGYLAIAANTQLVNFRSREANIAWRHWLSPTTGVLVGANGYTNPSYKRSGLNVGIFHDF